MFKECLVLIEVPMQPSHKATASVKHHELLFKNQSIFFFSFFFSKFEEKQHFLPAQWQVS
jgi:hypothetical protein